ncbi:MAG: hypothetical protein KC636_27575, partial [Myxococcales bacterium]|nr:hypothetical protein [Myxococcales bacterium]
TTDATTDATTGDDTTTTGVDTTTTSDATTTTTGDTDAPLGCDELPLCDGFDDVNAGGAPDPGRWQVVSPNCSGVGTLAVDDVESFAGGQSLRVDGGGGYCDHVFIANDAAVSAINGDAATVYGRFYLRLEAPLGPGHVTFATLRDDDDGGRDLR